MDRRKFVRGLAAAGAATLSTFPRTATAAESSKPGAYLVREFGAGGDGTTLDTKALQAAIDACASAGGGVVVLTPGTYLSGTLFLRSHVTLHLESGATLAGSRRLEDFPSTIAARRSYTDNYTERSLLYGEGLEQVAITGLGRIDGQGSAFKGPYKVRPYILRMVDCRGVCVRNITFLNSPMWVQHYLACDDVLIDGIVVRSQVNANNDGIDIDGCHNVRIANCDIRSGDDAIVLKSTLDRSCRNVAVSNCLLSSDCNAFKLGTESNGGFEDITLTNCVIYDTRLAGLAVETVDGGLLERVNLAHVVMRNVKCPIFVRLGNRARPFRQGADKPPVGRLRNIRIAYVQADNADRIGCSITGLPEQKAEDIVLEHIRIHFAGGGRRDTERAVPELPERYPEYSMFGMLPAYGLYCRHVTGLRFHDVRFTCAAPESRASLVCDDVEELEIRDWATAGLADQGPTVVCRNVRGAFVTGCVKPQNRGPFVRFEGADSANLRLVANDFTDPSMAVQRSEEVPAQVVSIR